MVNTARRYSQGAAKKAGVKIGNVRATIIAFGIKPVVMKIRYYN
jgi:hypothetical protein